MSDISTRLYQQGYKHKPPSEQVREIDSEVAAGMTCTLCGGSMYYSGWSKPGSYVALAICTKCGEEIEF